MPPEYRRGQRLRHEDLNAILDGSGRATRAAGSVRLDDGPGGRLIHPSGPRAFWAKITGPAASGRYPFHEVCGSTLERCGPDQADALEVAGLTVDVGTIVRMYSTAFDHRFARPCQTCTPPGCGCCGFKAGDTITMSCATPSPGSGFCDPTQHVAFRPIPFVQCVGGVAQFRNTFVTQSVEVDLACNEDGSVTVSWLRYCCFQGGQGGIGDYTYGPAYGCTPPIPSPSCDPLYIQMQQLYFRFTGMPSQCTNTVWQWVITR